MFIRSFLLTGRITPARSPVLAVTEVMGTCRQEPSTLNFRAVTVWLDDLIWSFGAIPRRVKR